ncbi:hypothetical protein ACFY8N_20795 [Streptomyces collinus]|uniref:hypothetical protein n=1 Tax=Streptomyces collinus TaxID=42684 RepID=UPI0036CCACC6
MTTHIERLVQQLGDATDPSYDARADRIDMSADALPTLIGGLPSLGGFGQLTAIEVFEEMGDPRCGPALIGVLKQRQPDRPRMGGHGLGEPGRRGCGRAPAPRPPHASGTCDPARLDRAGRTAFAGP